MSTEADRLAAEIACIDQMQWLIKDRPSVLEAYRSLQKARESRERALARLLVKLSSNPPVIVGPPLKVGDQ